MNLISKRKPLLLLWLIIVNSMTSILAMDSDEQGQGPSQHFESGWAASSENFEKCFGTDPFKRMQNMEFIPAQVPLQGQKYNNTFSSRKYDQVCTYANSYTCDE